MTTPPTTLRAARRAVARSSHVRLPWLIWPRMVPGGCEMIPEWPAMVAPGAFPGQGVILAGLGGMSLPRADAAAVDRLISLHGPAATVREAVPQWSASGWTDAGLTGRGRVWPRAAAESVTAAERAVWDAVASLRDGTIPLDCAHADALDAALDDWGRWWDVPERRREAIRRVPGILAAIAADPAVARYAPKGTDAVVEALARVSDAVHGGDGSSGEVDHRAATPSSHATPPPSGEAGQLPGTDSAATAEAPGRVSPAGADEAPAAADAARAAPATAESEPTPSEGGEDDRRGESPTAAPIPGPDRTADAEPAEGAAATETDAADQPDRDGPVAPQGGVTTDGAHRTHHIGSGREGGDTDPGQSDAAEAALASAPASSDGEAGSPKGTHGGRHADAATARRRAAALGHDAREVARALRRLIRADDVGAGEDPSPRLDGGRLVREIAGRSYRLSRARREEMVPSRIVIAPDLSGSCSAAAPETLAAAMAIAAEMPEVSVVETSNGQRLDDQPWDWTQVRTLLVLGDWDGGEIYRDAAEAGVRVLWLDSYGKAGGPRPSRDHAKGRFRDWPSPPPKWDGIGTAADAAIALRAMSRLPRTS